MSYPMMLWSVFLASIVGSYAQSEKPHEEIWFDPNEVLLQPEGSILNISWFTTLKGISRVVHHVEDEFISTVMTADEQKELYSSGNKTKNYTYMGQFETQANFIGYNKICLTLYNESDHVVGMGQLNMTVSLSYQFLNDVFTYILGVAIVFLYITMGATLDLDVIVDIIKKPIGPLIGLVCQYLLMPLFGFLIGLILFPNDPLLRLGLFLAGSSPGGGTSNMATHLLGGSLNLSIMMTSISTIVAFGFVPLWVFSLGPVILQGTEFVIPFKELAGIGAMMVVPCGIGFAIQHFLPRVATFLERIITPFSILFCIFVFVFGVYSNRYIFSIATWKYYLAGFGLPFIGYCSGALASVIFKRESSDVIAISIETGLQNSSIAILLLKFTFERPAADLTVVIPAITAMMTPVPLIVYLMVKKIIEWQTQRSDINRVDLLFSKVKPNQSNNTSV